MSNSSMPFSRAVLILKRDEEWLVRRNIPGRRMEQGARSRNFDVSVHFMYFHCGEKRSLVWKFNHRCQKGGCGDKKFQSARQQDWFRFEKRRVFWRLGIRKRIFEESWELGDGFLERAWAGREWPVNHWPLTKSARTPTERTLFGEN